LLERTGGFPPRGAIFRAFISRFRLIMMRISPRCYRPVAPSFGKGRDAPPARHFVIGGLIVSQLLTLFTTPVVYLYLDRFLEPAMAPPLSAPRRPGPGGAGVAGNELMEARDERRLRALQKHLNTVKLLIVDELGYVP
jgi:hypothetical protein